MTPESILAMCTQNGLDPIMINGVSASKVLVACVEVESNFEPHAIHLNVNENGAVTSIDYGIVQVNDFWHIGPGKDFATPEAVLSNPTACIEWMVKMFLAGKQDLWTSYSSGAYLKFLPKS